MAPLVFASLPFEITLRVLELADYKSLITCRKVCRALQIAIDGSSVLQFHIMMAATGVYDGSPKISTVSEKLAQLKAYDEAWQNGLWTEHTRSPMPRKPLWELYGGILASGGGRMLAFKQLPSLLRKIEAREWALTFDFVIRDCGLDASQDLLVIVEKCTEGPYLCRVHMRQLFTGQLHPLAPQSGLLPLEMLLNNTLWSEWTYSIRVSGDYVGILFSNVSGETELYIWNWRIGTVQLNIAAEEIRAYTFLGDKYVLVGSLPILGQESSGSSLIVYDILETGMGRDATRICTFQLPQAFDFNMASDPAPQWSPAADSLAPFYVAHTDRLIAVNLQSVQPDPRTYLLRSRDLLPYLLPSSNRASQARTILWQEWKHVCHRLQHGRWTSWSCFVYGMRYVSPQPVVRDGVRMVKIWDFHPLRSRRASPDQNDKGAERGPHASLKVVALPPELQGTSRIDFMISEDTIVAIETDTSSGAERSIHLLTF